MIKYFKQHSFWWSVINGLIPIIGLVFFKWSILYILFLLCYQFFLNGVFSCIAIVMSMGRVNKFMEGIAGRIFQSIGFALFYGLVLVMFISFLIEALDTHTLVDNFKGMGWSLKFVLLNYVINFTLGFIIGKRFVTSRPEKIMIRSSLLIIPLLFIILILMFVFPNQMSGNGSNINLFITSGFIIAKTILDMVVTHYGGG
ncbi:MAG: hypothetical protein HXX13_09330 [Bacteroidetes bacterium]|nr:hypothetical protein [Bacteroidota bacterium]